MGDRTTGKKTGTTRSLSPPPAASRHRGRSKTRSKFPTNSSRSNSPSTRAAENASPARRRVRTMSPPRRETASKSAPVPESPPKSPPKPPTAQDWGAVHVPEHQDDDEFYQAVKRCIPSEFVLIASQDDVNKAQEDYYAMDHFQLKPPEGKVRWLNSELAGSVATCALLQLMQENPDRWVAKSAKDTKTKPFSTLEILQEIQERIKVCSKQDANPTITSSRPLGPPRFDEGVYAPYYVVPPKYVKGTRRALLIACVSGEGEKDLKGTVNDVANIQNFLLKHCGFKEENMTVLQETYKVPAEQQPTKKNITAAFKKMVEDSQPGDINFIQFSGHGNRNHTNLYILPSDYKQSGYIQDERILKNLIKAMPAGVYTTMLVDCCYSGTIGDLPYILKADSTDQQIEGDFDTTINKKAQRANAANAAANGNKKAKFQPSQSIRTFYDTDTREETLEKEAKGDEEYKRLKAARREKTTWMNFEPHKLYESSKKSMKKAAKGAKKGANSAIDGIDDAIDSAIEAAKRTSKSIKKSFASVSPMRSKKDKDKEPLPNKTKKGEDSDSNKTLSTSASTHSSGSSSAASDPLKLKSNSALNKGKAKDNKDLDSPPSKKNNTKAKSPIRKTKSTGGAVAAAAAAKGKPAPPSVTRSPNKKKPIRRSKSTGAAAAGGAAPIKPPPKRNSKPMKSAPISAKDEDEEEREFEAAIAKAKAKRNGVRSQSPGGSSPASVAPKSSSSSNNNNSNTNNTANKNKVKVRTQ